MTDVRDRVSDEPRLKTAYAYSQQTGEYCGVVMAEPDQLDEGNWLLPAHATFTAPIKVADGDVAVWQDSAWAAMTDQRGVAYWDEEGTQHSISELSDSVPDNALLEAPVIPPTVAEQTALASSECTARIQAQWDRVGQINASLGMYGEAEKTACAQWIVAHRAALLALLARDDLVDIDVTDDVYWKITLEKVAKKAVKKTVKKRTPSKKTK